MASRIRTIKPEFYAHENLFDAEHDFKLPLRLAFSGLWTCCDREGRFEWRPRTLKAAILPFDELDFSDVLDALMTRGFIIKYRVENKDYGYVPSWNKHQVINNRERASIFPVPDEKSIFEAGCDASTTRGQNPFALHVHAQVEGKGREGKGRDKKIRSKIDASTTRQQEIELPDFIQQADWADFLEHRKKLKKPMTGEAQRRAISKLTDFHNAGHDVSAIISESIINGWQGFFEPKNFTNGVTYAKPLTESQQRQKSSWDNALAGVQRSATAGAEQSAVSSVNEFN